MSVLRAARVGRDVRPAAVPNRSGTCQSAVDPWTRPPHVGDVLLILPRVGTRPWISWSLVGTTADGVNLGILAGGHHHGPHPARLVAEVGRRASPCGPEIRRGHRAAYGGVPDLGRRTELYGVWKTKSTGSKREKDQSHTHGDAAKRIGWTGVASTVRS